MLKDGIYPKQVQFWGVFEGAKVKGPRLKGAQQSSSF